MSVTNNGKDIISTTHHSTILDLFLYAAYNRKRVVTIRQLGLDTDARRDVEDDCSENVTVNAFCKYLKLSSQECSINISEKFDPTRNWTTKDFSKLVELTTTIYNASDRLGKKAAKKATGRSGAPAKDAVKIKTGELLDILEALGFTVTFTLNRLSPSDEIKSIWKKNDGVIPSELDSPVDNTARSEPIQVKPKAKSLEELIRDL